MMSYYDRANGTSLSSVRTTLAAPQSNSCERRSVAETVRRRLQVFDSGLTPQPVSGRRRRPVMWCGSDSYSTTAGTKRSTCHRDDEDEDSSDDEDDVGILPLDLPPRRANKKRRGVVSPCPTPPRPASPSLLWDPYQPGTFYRKRIVKFADPIVTEVRTRPRTLSEDVKWLFYSKADKMRFLREVRDEKRLRSLGEWDSDEED
uniref:Uncharacterized protein n=1 Tax=Pseudictyota dubia TaxID=2749911 RepID=A0A7R9W1P9_9STRA|mmetsp:Transcript_28971/g.53783  ORF Transcript_28971/g.53783 Transcript_28971/m.53783 type:complete len:203 (+) Transcript_28971:244-852(+)